MSGVKRSLIIVVIDRFRFSRSTFGTKPKTGKIFAKVDNICWLYNSFSFHFLACRDKFFLYDGSKIVRYYVKLMDGFRAMKCLIRLIRRKFGADLIWRSAKMKFLARI